MFLDQGCENRTETVHGTLGFLFLLSPVVWNMCENLHYKSVYFKELHNDQEYCWPTIYTAGAAVVSTITSDTNSIGLSSQLLFHLWRKVHKSWQINSY